MDDRRQLSYNIQTPHVHLGIKVAFFGKGASFKGSTGVLFFYLNVIWLVCGAVALTGSLIAKYLVYRRLMKL